MMPGDHLHCLGYRKHPINGRKCYYGDIIMLLTSESICQARIIRASWKKRMCLKAIVRANKSRSRRRVSRDEAKGNKSQEVLAFYSKCKKQAKCLQQEGENGEMGPKGSGGQVGG